jgi:hypothetical protein
MLATDFNKAELTGWSCGKTVRNKYHFYHQGHGICPRALPTTWVVIQDWAKYDDKPNCCATCLALLALAAPAPEPPVVAEQEPAPFDQVQDAQHPEPVAPARPRPTVTSGPQSVQLTLF